VSSTGRVVFSGPGTAVITARSGTATATVSLTAQRREFVGASTGSIVSGQDATCGLLPLGKTFCFGVAPVIGVAKDTSCFGDTGGSPSPCTLIPLQIAGQLQLTTLTAGDNVACGLDAQNRAYCWGDNSAGQIGNGVAAPGTSSLPHLVTGPRSAVATFTKIAAGRNHVCALSSTGVAYCWGADASNQLGNGDGLAINSSTPIPVGGGFTYSAIAAGRAHSCGIRSADGVAVCWGSNARGQLGRGTIGSAADTPAPVSSTVAFSQISTKGDFTCALSTSGSIYCWGANFAGETGQTPDTTFSTPVPTAISGSGYSAVTAGWSHACALSGSAAASCWGANAFGQLGNGTWNTSANPTPSAINGFTFSAISAGSRSTCAVAADGAYCWGSSVYGATGNQIQALKVLAPSKTATPQ
jgi:alpha-tubulin suppressor-like RCC1 family protein